MRKGHSPAQYKNTCCPKVPSTTTAVALTQAFLTLKAFDYRHYTINHSTNFVDIKDKTFIPKTLRDCGRIYRSGVRSQVLK